MGKIKYLVCLVIVLFLTGCGGIKKSDVFLEYHRSGGIIGLDDQLTIDMEGNAILKSRNAQAEFSLDVETLKRLETLLNNATFTKLKKDYLPAQPGADLIEYTISYNGHTVLMKDTAVPEIMQPVLEFLNHIVDNRG